MDKLSAFFLSRYLKAPKRNILRFSFIFMILGIILSVGILTAGLNLFEGYERTLRDVLLGAFPHITVTKANLHNIAVSETEFLTAKIAKQKEVLQITPLLSYPVMTAGEEKVRGASLNAYNFNSQTPFPQAKYIQKGKKVPAPGEVIIGKYLAQELGKDIGDTLKVVFTRLDNISALGIFPSEYYLPIAGIYSSGFYETDRSLLLTNYSDAAKMLNDYTGFSKLEIRLKEQDIDRAAEIAQHLQTVAGPEYSVYPWQTFSAGLLHLVAMEKWLIFIIFCFLVLIAGINVISAVATIILDKRNQIAVLKTLGAKPSTIKRVLSFQVGLSSLLAIIAGQIFGALLSFIIEKQNFYRLKGDVYFIDSLHTSIVPLNQLIIFAVSATLVFICIYFPLKQIDKLEIIELLRNP
ncbi:MAG: ABC transporter permease [Candidatus Cloacimonas sp.]|jgi:lipoprotein-releasing system permease protein|nr:ABC transporter permease [Candidatus Cloacimonas sp.]HNX02730.1 ABC transporter permease [Candidatus Cloacimonas sp.]HPS61159.1 ABC transporter permease [Candidatus Cloacimonas sp.]